MERPFCVVFVTASEEHAIRAFDLDAVDYIVKPIDFDRCDRAMRRLLETLGSPSQAPDAAVIAAVDVALWGALQALHGDAPCSQRHSWWLRHPRAGQSLSSCGFGIPKSAVRAWNTVPPDTDLRRWVLSHALLAPNPHNMQPWIADLSADAAITLRLDTTRVLPETDPYGRPMLMGCGAFLELLSLAAAERGHRAEIALFPSGPTGSTLDGRAVATIRLTADASIAPDPLFKQVRERRTDRREYDAQLQSIRKTASSAWSIELRTKRTMMETMRVLRFGSREIDRHRDGLVITSPTLVTLKRLGLLNPSKFPHPTRRRLFHRSARLTQSPRQLRHTSAWSRRGTRARSRSSQAAPMRA